MVNEEKLARFLEGRNSKKYIVSVEVPYSSNEVSLVINDPEKGKYVSKDDFHSFIWFKEEITKIMFGGKRVDIKKNLTKFGVTLTKQKVNISGGYCPKRMDRGFKYMAKCNGSYGKLLNFFKAGGIDVYGEAHKRYFVAISPVEQYLISSGRRLFKGMDDYDDLHRLQFDLETTGLYPKGALLSQEEIKEIKETVDVHDLVKLYELDINGDPIRYKDAEIFQIGIKDNRGTEEILECSLGTTKERNNSEIYVIFRLFEIIDELRPDTIVGYNSENFDWDFIFTRCEILGLEIEFVAKTLDSTGYHKIKRVNKSIKLGGEREYYKQTQLWGYNVLDASHAVRRAKAINSNQKGWGLKYITKFAELNKKNRVYVKGDKIHSTWADTDSEYAFNNSDGDWYKITPERQLEKGYDAVLGKTIIRRYLLDDLWETEKVDEEFNQASFLLSKIIPTSYMRSTTMGTAGIWKLIMLAWSYENRLAIPDIMPQKTFTGGLSRLLEVGFAKNVAKLDYAALYPNIELTWDIFPDTDITGVMKGMLLYIASTRDKFKGLMNYHKDEKEKMEKFLNNNSLDISQSEIKLVKEEIERNGSLSRMYDKKQLPIKILGNSFFGSLGAPNIFNWGDTQCAEETTCRARQYLRLMVLFFVNKGFRPLVGDSVTGRTPVYIRYNNTREIDIIPIQDLFIEKTIDIEGQERDFSNKEYQILTKDGWQDIEYVYRHKTDKAIHRITTRDRMIECTSDHSLFNNGKEVTPKGLVKGDNIDVIDLKSSNIYANYINISKDVAWLLGFFVADGSAIYGDRKQNYFSKRKNRIVEHNGKRAEWTISNKDASKLEKAKEIILREYFNVTPRIKDYNKSSGVYKLKTHYAEFSKWFSENCYDKNRTKKIPKCIINGNKDIKRSFIDGFACGDGWGDNLNELKNVTQKSQTVMAGIHLILSELGIDFTLKLRKDKPNIVAFNLGEKYPTNITKSHRKTDEVWSNNILDIKNEYVYDISANGTFIAGIGTIIAHNTDGFNFAIPENVNINTYTPKGTHRFTEKNKDKTLIGLDAVVAEFNEMYMIGRMGLDIDDICESTINFSRKNYGNLIKKGDKLKVKLVGNTIKSSKMPIYIEEFLDAGIKFLLNGEGYEFIQLYNKTVEKIYNFQIPLVKIASKSNVKQSVSAYKADMETKTKSGSFKAKKAHMELIIKDKLITNLGDTIYYVNTGTMKSHGDVKVIIDKETGERTVKIQCMRIPTDQIENNPELTTSDYNVPKYLEAFNKRIRPLLVCFKPEIRDKILTTMVKNKKTQQMELTKINVFTRKNCEMSNGIAFKDGDQDTMEELMTMEDKEIEFWMNINKEPNNLEDLGFDWPQIQADFIERKRIERLEGIQQEKDRALHLIKKLEIDEISQIKKTTMLTAPLEAFTTFTVHNDNNGNPNIYLKSNKWGVDLASVQDMFKYEKWAEQRAEFYLLEEDVKKHTYENWLSQLWLQAFKKEEFSKADAIKKELKLAGVDMEKLITISQKKEKV
jgi:hypothetical protein